MESLAMIMLAPLIVLGCCWFTFFGFISGRPKNFPPGPIWFPIVGNLPLVKILHAQLGYFHLVWEKLAKQYGNLVGLKLGGDRVVLCSGFEAVKCIYGKEDCGGKCEGVVFRVCTYGEKLGLGCLDGIIWSKTRAFVIKTLEELGAALGTEKMQDIVTREASDLVDVLNLKCQNEKQEYKEEHLGSLFRMSILNCQWALISGDRFNIQDEKLVSLQKLVAKFVQSADFSGCFMVNQIPWVRFIAPETSGYNAMMALVGPLHDFFKDLVENHARKCDYRELLLESMSQIFEENKLPPNLRDPSTHPTRQKDVSSAFIGTTVRAIQPNLVFNTKQQICALMDQYMTGTETLTNLLAFMLQYLVLFPRIQDELRCEIDSVIGRCTKPMPLDLERMPYLNAFIAESVRFSNVAPIPSPHRAMTDFEIFQYTIPQDTILFLNLHSVHMDKEHWGDPEVFRPQRFLDKTGTYHNDDWLVPFGLGCCGWFGETLTKNTIFTLLVTILQSFVIDCPENEEIDEAPKESMTLCPKDFTGIIKKRR